MKYLIHIFLIFFGSQLAFSQELEFIPFATGFNTPVDLVHAGDSMLYVVEKRGTIQLLDLDGNTGDDAFLDIRGRVSDNRNERGLLGLVFHPDYPSTPYFYVNYTNNSGNTVIARFEVDSNNLNEGLPNSEKIILTINQPFSNHNAGDLLFGHDGYLYIPMGDGGDAGDPRNHSQNPMSLLGKLLRIDVDNGDPYAIPPDNPWADDDFTSDEIWAFGLRNPWRADFDPLTGDLFIADVGQNAFEEINFQPANSTGAENYGWRCYEAAAPFNLQNCADSGYTFPVFAYPHPPGSFCRASISGGVIYRGNNYPELYGKYIYGDYCSGVVGLLYQDDNLNWHADTVTFFEPFDITSFGRDMNGELYMVGSGSGSIYSIRYQTSSIEEIQSNNRIIIQNPVGQFIQILPDIAFSSGRIFDAQGKQMEIIPGSERNIDVSDWAPGIYFIRLNVADKSVSQKIIIQ